MTHTRSDRREQRRRDAATRQARFDDEVRAYARGAGVREREARGVVQRAHDRERKATER